MTSYSGPLFTKWTNVLSQDLVKSQSHVIGCYKSVSLWSLKNIQQRRDACQISERLEKSKPESLGFDASRDFAIRRPSAENIIKYFSNNFVKFEKLYKHFLSTKCNWKCLRMAVILSMSPSVIKLSSPWSNCLHSRRPHFVTVYCIITQGTDTLSAASIMFPLCRKL